MDEEPDAAFFERNTKFRSGTGILIEVTADQKKAIKADLHSWYTEKTTYNFVTRNCGDPIEAALEKLGFNLGANLTPNGLEASLEGSGHYAGYIWYPGRNTYK